MTPIVNQQSAISNAARRLLPAAAFAYVLLIRTYGISRHFWLFGDQVRDWRIALGPLTDLPLAGPPQHAGGNALGPVFYWVLWAIRVLVGPFFDNLPHAGGIGLSILQSAADALLLVAIWRRFGSVWLAVATVLIVASAPYDLALSATIWNPILSEALAKTAIALVLLERPARPLPRAIVLSAVAWLAFQAHISAVFVAASVLAWIVGAPLVARRFREAALAAASAAAVVLALQAPYIAFRLTHESAAASPIVGSLIEMARDPRSLRLAASAESFTRALNLIQLEPWRASWIGWALALGAAVAAVRHRRDPAVLAASILPLAAALGGFALWVGDYDRYFYLTIMPSAVLTAGLAVASLAGRRLAAAAGIGWLVLAVAAQPARLGAAAGIHRLPEYEAVLRAAREIARRGQPIRGMQAEFLPPGCNPNVLVEILGGRVDRAAGWYVMVSRDGGVTYRAIEP